MKLYVIINTEDANSNKIWLSVKYVLTSGIDFDNLKEKEASCDFVSDVVLP